MSKDDKKRRQVKPSVSPVEKVFMYFRGEVLDWLEEERRRRGGREAGVKLQPIIHEKLHARMRDERRRGL